MTTQIEVSNLITPFIDAFKAVSNELKNYFETGLTDYLQSQTEKYYLTYTFLHRNEKVRFKEIYYPVKATYHHLTTTFSDLQEVFEEYKKIIIVGFAGSGKSTLLRSMFLSVIENIIKIPVIIELRNLNEYPGTFEELVAEKVLKVKLKPSDVTFRRTLSKGNFLFLLDGYDEIFSGKKQQISREIEAFIDAYSQNWFVITTRPGSGIEGFHRFYNFKIESLQDHEVPEFIIKVVKETEKKKRILMSIHEHRGKYFEYLTNPLLLSMFIFTFEHHPEIPRRKSAFYRNVFDTLFSQHDGRTKNSFSREKLTKLQREDFETILSYFSYSTFVQGQYTFTFERLSDVLSRIRTSAGYNYVVQDLIYDLHTSISVLVLDGLEYHFPHRSMQEYFTVFFISKLPTGNKIKAYKNLEMVLEKSEDYFAHFFDLCNEMDHESFLSIFLVPNLQLLYNKIKNQEGYDLLEGFLDILNPLLGTVRYSSEILDAVIYSKVNLAVKLLGYLQIKDNGMYHFPSDSGCANELVSILKRKAEEKGFPFANVHLYIEDNQEVKTVLYNFNFNERVYEFRAEIATKLEKLHDDLALQKSSLNVFLDFEDLI